MHEKRDILLYQLYYVLFLDSNIVEITYAIFLKNQAIYFEILTEIFSKKSGKNIYPWFLFFFSLSIKWTLTVYPASGRAN